MKTTKEALRDFIETYKCLPCLWDTTDEMYLNKRAREQAYKILLEKFKVLNRGEDSTIDGVKKKIDNLRCTYKREHKKVLASLRQGGEEYCPSLWYYDLMSFLTDYREVGTGTKSTQDKSCTSDDDDNVMMSEHDSSNQIKEELQAKKRRLEEVYFEHNNDEDEHDDEDAFLVSHESNTIHKEDSESVSFGKTVGLQLKELTDMQRAIAEKLISEVIFYGRLEKLNLNSTFFVNEQL